jgi:hypothetical protein
VLFPFRKILLLVLQGAAEGHIELSEGATRHQSWYRPSQRSSDQGGAGRIANKGHCLL